MDDESDLRQALVYTQHAYEALSQTLETERRATDAGITALRAELARSRADVSAARSVAQELTRLAAGLQKACANLLARRPVEWLRAWRAARRPDVATIAASPLFDRGWYAQRYPDVAASKQDPAEHYARFGAIEGRDPGPNFSTLDYMIANPDVIAAGANPLSHYERHGRVEGRATRPPALFATAVTRRDIVFISGEPGTPGHIYRIRRPAEAASGVGLSSLVLTLAEAEADPVLLSAQIVVIWRAAWSARVAAIFQAARSYGARIIFDVDDLMFEPELATFRLFDGIRTQSLTEQVVSDFYGQVRATLLAADAGLSPTEFLSERMRRCGKPAFVLPNGFDETTRRVSAAALAARRGAGAPSVQRIGYAGGTRTHQKDFAVIAAPVAAALRQAPNRRLVLFRRGEAPCLDISEFPEFAGLEAQIEWREMVGLPELPWELARFDINLAPLELDNPYCEAKSELKFFEAALVGVPTIATPTQPFRDAIREGETGFLAAEPQAWLTHITNLLDNPGLRAQLAKGAFASVEESYGTNKRAEILGAIMRALA